MKKRLNWAGYWFDVITQDDWVLVIPDDKEALDYYYNSEGLTIYDVPGWLVYSHEAWCDVIEHNLNNGDYEFYFTIETK